MSDDPNPRINREATAAEISRQIRLAGELNDSAASSVAKAIVARLIAATPQEQPSAEYLRGYAARESISGQHCAKCENAECPGNVAPQLSWDTLNRILFGNMTDVDRRAVADALAEAEARP